MGQKACGEVVGKLGQPHATAVGWVMEQVVVAAAGQRQVKMHAVARAPGIGLGHEGADHAEVVGDLAGGHAEEGEAVGRLHGVAVGVVDLELAVGVLVVDLVDVEAHRLQRLGQALEEQPRARQALVVVARLVEVVGGVHQLQLAAFVAAEQAELGLKAGVQGPAFVGQALHLLLQHVAAVVGPGLAVYVAYTHHPAVTRLPRYRDQGGKVAAGHEVGAVRFHAHAADGEPGKAGALLGHHLQARDRHRFGLRRAMDIDELRQHVLDAVLVEGALGFCWQHGLITPG
ncbi:hypothetical protein D3C79_304680 [compost metagenome]